MKPASTCTVVPAIAAVGRPASTSRSPRSRVALLAGGAWSTSSAPSSPPRPAHRDVLGDRLRHRPSPGVTSSTPLQTSVNPKVIECPGAASRPLDHRRRRTGRHPAKAKARSSPSARNINNLIGGATRNDHSPASSARASSRPSARQHAQVRARQPDDISARSSSPASTPAPPSRSSLDRHQDVDVGENIGAPNSRPIRPRPTRSVSRGREARALALASNGKQGQIQENRALVVLARPRSPKATEWPTPWVAGTFGVMDYYRLGTSQADTAMRRPSPAAVEPQPGADAHPVRRRPNLANCSERALTSRSPRVLLPTCRACCRSCSPPFSCFRVFGAEHPPAPGRRGVLVIITTPRTSTHP